MKMSYKKSDKLKKKAYGKGMGKDDYKKSYKGKK
jgi:hypothetical protein